MSVRVQDASGEAYLSVFNDQAVKIVGCTADELNELKSKVGTNLSTSTVMNIMSLGFQF